MNKFILSILCVLIVGIGLGALHILPKKNISSTECANEFSSSYYKDYQAQLLTFVHSHPLLEPIKNASITPFNSHLQKLIRDLEQPLGDASQQRLYHENFVHQLREALTLSSASILPEEENARSFYQDLVQWIFLQADLRPSTLNYFYSLVQGPQAATFEALIPTLKALRAEKKFSRVRLDEEPSKDPFLHGNLPYRLLTLPNDSATVVFRMAYPLNDLNKLHLPWVTLFPQAEFLTFIENQPRHLYVNLMKRKGSESSASQALEQLETRHSNLCVVTLDRNSDFYWQNSKIYPAALDSSTFKTLFLNQLLDQEGSFYWTTALDLPNWKNELNSILDHVLTMYFPKQSFLDREERLDYIELAYLAILDKLVEKLNPSSMNITCRQCMDRGPALYVLWMLQKNQISEKELVALLLTPPILIHNRPSHLSRIERFRSAAKRISFFN